MVLDDIKFRMDHIQESIKATTAQVQGYTQSLNNANQQLQSLHGHLNECLYWKQALEQEECLIKEAELAIDTECCNGQVNFEDESEAA